MCLITKVFWFSTQSVSLSILCSLDIYNLEVVYHQYLYPTYLSVIQFLSSNEINEILIVCKDLDLMFRSLQVHSLFSEGVYNYQQFFIIDFVVKFYWRQFPRVVYCQLLFPLLVGLAKHCSNSIVRGICFHSNFLIQVEGSQDRYRGEDLLQFVKSFLYFLRLIPQLVFIYKYYKGYYYP